MRILTVAPELVVPSDRAQTRRLRRKPARRLRPDAPLAERSPGTRKRPGAPPH